MAPSVQQIDRPSSEAVYSGNHDNTSSSSSRSANGKSPAGSVKGKTYTSKECIELEHHYGAHNYHPLPVVFDKASGSNVWDPEGKEYIDMLSAYSAVNQGHCHPKIVNALITQAQRLTLSSRAFHSSPLGPYTEKVTSLLGFDMLLPMNTGVEAVETAIKLSRKWAYEVKGVPEGKAIVLSAENNFHGRTIGVISMSTDPESRKGFGPFLKGVGPICPFEPKEGEEQRRIRYNNIGDLERVLEKHGKEVAAFLVEPIQGEAGIVVPAEDYLEKAQALCRKHQVLLICDEIQTGLGRTGKMMCFQHNPNVKPDIVTLGKALSGGVYPVSAVLASKEIMMCIRPGEHGSTYGGNPLGCAVASAALDVLVEEDLANRAERLGKIFRAELEELKNPWIQEVRGKGLLNAIVIDEAKSQKGRGAWQLCLLMKSRGLLAKPTHRNIIRLAPPLVIPEEDLHRAVKIIGECLNDLEEVDVIPGEDDEEKDYHNELDD